MKSLKSFFLVSIAIVLVLGGVFISMIQAQDEATDDSASIGISPLFFDLSAEPGQTTASQVLRVTNKSSKPMTRYIGAMDLVPASELGQSQLVSPEENEYGFSLAKWIKLDKTQIKFSPQDEQNITFSVQVPADAEPGGHYGAIVVSSQPNQETIEAKNVGAGVVFGHRVAALVFVNAGGEVKEEGKILSFIPNRRIYDKPPVEFSVRFSNTGNVHLIPTGKLNIYKVGKEEKVGTLIVNEAGGRTLPKTIRDYQTKWEPKEKLKWGKYKATINLNYGSTNTGITEVTYFWIIPWKMLLIIAACLLLVFFVLRAYIRRKVRQEIHRRR